MNSRTTWWRPLERSDRWALVVLLAIPTVLFGVPALAGHPAIAADNLIQNFPLRVLSGQQMRTGHLPLLNPLANSTTPLLGGMNAGSFFPLTFLFVFLPPLVAWVANLVAVYVASAMGMFALLRWHGLRTSSSIVAALVFTYSGAMVGQMVHLGVIQGFALLPWTVLALLSMARALRHLADGSPTRQKIRASAPGVLSLAVLWGLACLSGEPRAIAEIELLTMIVAPCAVLVHSSCQPSTWRRRLVYLVGVGVGVLWGIVIGLAQLLPGWNFIAQSQRSSISYWFFGAGSLVVRWTSMLFIQTINGANSQLGSPHFFTNYNLPEVTGYVGILALVATFGYVARLTRRGWRLDDREYVVYFVIVVIGLFATWGGFTPLGHVFQHIPLFGSTRLQSRNIVLVDFGATVLLGRWLERLSAGDVAGAGLVGARRWLTLSPALFTIVLSAAMMLRGPSIARFMGAVGNNALQASHETLTLVLQLAIAGSIVWLVTVMARSAKLVRWLVVVTTIDVFVFLLFSSTGFSSGHVNPMPSRSQTITAIGGHGRFAFVDPSGAHDEAFENLGSPNLNVFTRLSSVQGYGSLIDSTYGNATDTHPLFTIGACQLADGAFKQLRLATVVVGANQLATPVTATTPHPTWCFNQSPSTSTARYFGQYLDVESIVLEGRPGESVSSGPVKVRLLNGEGQPFGATITRSGSSTLRFDFSTAHEVAAGVVISAPAKAVVYSTTVVQRYGLPSWRLNNGYQQALSTTWWRLAKTEGTLAIFRAHHIGPTTWLGAHATTSRISAVENATWGDSWITVHATHPTVLLRSDEWLPGWRATAVNQSTGASIVLPVKRTGLIMKVTVPTGAWQVHFHYHAPYIELGLAATGAGVVALLGALGLTRRWSLRRRKGRVQA